jgi:hypothetical protein
MGEVNGNMDGMKEDRLVAKDKNGFFDTLIMTDGATQKSSTNQINQIKPTKPSKLRHKIYDAPFIGGALSQRPDYSFKTESNSLFYPDQKLLPEKARWRLRTPGYSEGIVSTVNNFDWDSKDFRSSALSMLLKQHEEIGYLS